MGTLPGTTATDAFAMIQTMRWFGPSDPVSLRDIRQAGASQVVTALHEVPNGEIWTQAAIAGRRALIKAAGLDWTVVESVPVHEAIKTRGADRDRFVDAYRQSLRNLAACGITTVTYNFMPLLDWTRTDLAWELPDGARALRFEWEMVAAYDIHMLRRPGAEGDYAPDVVAAAARRFAAMDDAARHRLERTIIAGLPGSEESFTSAEFLAAIGDYADTDADRLRANLHQFLADVCPVAEELGLRLVIHPDDPPFPIFGLPRVVSTSADLGALFAAVPSPANGLCFCTGSLGARPDNDLPAMVRRHGERIGFLHLRSVALEGERTFHEAAHLEGSARMAEVVAAVVDVSRAQGRSIPMRPDHGHQMLDDLGRTTNPGYSLLGRMRGLAELRGLERGIMAAHRHADATPADRPSRDGLTIRLFTDERAADFKRINTEWIADMYRLEQADIDVLDHPRDRIVDPGGDILFVEDAVLGIVGTCALQKTGERQFELTKMGVLAAARGRKAGEFLLQATIARAFAMGCDRLYLLSNGKSAAAIHLYEKLGFVHDAGIMAEFGRRYERCDVAMLYAANGGAG